LQDHEGVPRVTRSVLREARRRALRQAAQAWSRLHRQKLLKDARAELR
jgi:hypothetical protein